jgi:hypothetical protein
MISLHRDLHIKNHGARIVKYHYILIETTAIKGTCMNLLNYYLCISVFFFATLIVNNEL